MIVFVHLLNDCSDRPQALRSAMVALAECGPRQQQYRGGVATKVFCVRPHRNSGAMPFGAAVGDGRGGGTVLGVRWICFGRSGVRVT